MLDLEPKIGDLRPELVHQLMITPVEIRDLLRQGIERVRQQVHAAESGRGDDPCLAGGVG